MPVRSRINPSVAASLSRPSRRRLRVPRSAGPAIRSPVRPRPPRPPSPARSRSGSLNPPFSAVWAA